MAGSLNSVQLIGNVGKDPEIRSMQNGKQVANLSIATGERWKDKEGEWQERTEWHNVVVWGPLASVVEKYVQKGSKLYVKGQIQTRKWEKDGVTRYSTEIVLQGFGAELILLSEKPGGGGERSEKPATASRPPAKAGAGSQWDDDDIPF